MWVVHVVKVFCLAQLTCMDECGAWGEMCMCLARGSVGGEGVSGFEDWIWALQIL